MKNKLVTILIAGLTIISVSGCSLNLKDAGGPVSKPIEQMTNSEKDSYDTSTSESDTSTSESDTSTSESDTSTSESDTSTSESDTGDSSKLVDETIILIVALAALACVLFYKRKHK